MKVFFCTRSRRSCSFKICCSQPLSFREEELIELFLEIIVKFVSLVSSIFDFCVDFVPMEKFDCDFESKSLKEDDDDNDGDDEDDEQGDSNLIV